MKAIIICNDDNVIKEIDDILRELSFETIIYKWLLKALDNVEEIKPDIVIISTSDYPRHWKTFSQFVKSNIAGKTVNIFLYAQSSLSEDDIKKATELNIKYIFTSTSDISNIKNILSNDNTEKDLRINVKENESLNILLEDESTNDNITTDENTNTEQDTKCETLIFTHPKKDIFVTGKIVSFSNDIIEVLPDIEEATLDINEGDIIIEMSFKKDNDYFYSTASVVSIGLTILLQPNY